MTQPQAKMCPKCRAVAPLDAGSCQACGHQYRTDFRQNLNATQVVNRQATDCAFFHPEILNLANKYKSARGCMWMLLVLPWFLAPLINENTVFFLILVYVVSLITAIRFGIKMRGITEEAHKGGVSPVSWKIMISPWE